MSKTQIQLTNENESNSIQKSKKSKFNKFFSTVTAVMIASSIAMGPMTLRGEETENKDKPYTVKDVKEDLKEMKKTVNEIKIEIEKRKAEEMKKVEEATKEYCAKAEVNIPIMKKYCSENKCTDEQNKILTESLKNYKEKCEKLIVEKK